MNTTHMRSFLSAALAGLVLAVLSISPARGAEILEEGAGYHIIAYEAGWDQNTGAIAGWVAMRIDAPIIVSTQAKILNTIHSISPSPGWTYTVRKAGGYNASIEIDFQSSSGCSARFKALYKPGKTTIDGGRVDCP